MTQDGHKNRGLQEQDTAEGVQGNLCSAYRTSSRRQTVRKKLECFLFARMRQAQSSQIASSYSLPQESAASALLAKNRHSSEITILQ